MLWVILFSYAIYFFGNMPMVQKNLKWLIVAIIMLSVLPCVVEVWRQL